VIVNAWEEAVLLLSLDSVAYICLQQVLTHTYSYIDSQLTVVSHTVLTYNIHNATEPSTLASPG